MEDKHVQEIPQEIVEKIKNELVAAKDDIKPYSVTLTPHERRTIIKMGDKSMAFVEKALEFAIANPELRSPLLNIEEFKIDFSDAHKLWTIRNAAKQVFELLDDTTMAAGSEAFQEALIFYNYIKIAAKQDVPGAKAIYEELKRRFPGGRHKSANADEKISDVEE
jgi:hypothetical protein